MAGLASSAVSQPGALSEEVVGLERGDASCSLPARLSCSLRRTPWMLEGVVRKGRRQPETKVAPNFQEDVCQESFGKARVEDRKINCWSAVPLAQ